MRKNEFAVEMRQTGGKGEAPGVGVDHDVVKRMAVGGEGEPAEIIHTGKPKPRDEPEEEGLKLQPISHGSYVMGG